VSVILCGVLWLLAVGCAALALGVFVARRSGTTPEVETLAKVEGSDASPVTFTRMSPQHLVRSSGYEILPGGRYARLYRDQSGEIEVEVEFGFAPSGRACVTVAPGAFSVWRGGRRASREEQRRVEANFREAMTYDGLECFVWDEATSRFVDGAAGS
jgi:hypothetical protein